MNLQTCQSVRVSTVPQCGFLVRGELPSSQFFVQSYVQEHEEGGRQHKASTWLLHDRHVASPHTSGGRSVRKRWQTRRGRWRRGCERARRLQRRC